MGQSTRRWLGQTTGKMGVLTQVRQASGKLLLLSAPHVVSENKQPDTANDMDVDESIGGHRLVFG